MLRRNLIVLFLIFISIKTIAQDTISQEKDSLQFQKILIIPFNPKMYMSDADKEIIEASNLDFTRLVDNFRYGLAILLKDKLSPYYEAKVLFNKAASDSIDDLPLIYSSLTYRAEILKDGSGLAQRDEASNSHMKNGELAVKKDSREKFINIVVKNQELLPLLTSKYGLDYFIFINQFEIKSDLSDYAAVGINNYSRNINVHYTILDVENKEIAKNIAKVNFPSKINNVQEIINRFLPTIADNILFSLPNPKIIKPADNSSSKKGK